jgi:hypothetical protein
MIREIVILLVLLTTNQFSVLSQFYNAGQGSTSIKWQQINTNHFQVIYPAGFYKQANKTANLIEQYFDSVSADYSIKPEKTPVLLYNESVESNAFASWAPRRMEWITTPPQESYSQNWLKQLAIHETRHIVQISNLDQGFTKILKPFIGQAAVGAVTGILPLWFLEGDAVMAETKYSASGRGRLNSFDRELRTIEVELPQRYSYDQSYLGSYKYYVPDHYRYGYQMVSYAYLKYNSNIWNKVLSHVGKHSYQIIPFYFGLHKQTGLSKAQLYTQTFDSLKKLWNNELYLNTIRDTLNIFLRNKYYSNYLYPHQFDELTYAVKTSLDDITKFVCIKGSEETIIHIPGWYYRTKTDFTPDYIVWEEIKNHPRWEYKDYSVLKLFNIKTQKVKYLSRKSRYFSPDIAPSGKKIVCVEIDLNNNYSLTFLEISSGKILSTYRIVDFEEVSFPAWVSDSSIVFIGMAGNEKKIVLINLNSHKTEVIFNAGAINIDQLTATDSLVFFKYDYELAENIYMLSLADKKVIRLTSSKHGACYPSYNKATKTLAYSDYTLNGFIPRILKYEFFSEPHVSGLKQYKHCWAESIYSHKNDDTLEMVPPEVLYDTSSFRRLANSINIHSWAPFYFNTDDLINMNPQIYPGFTLLSQSKLSTVTSSFSYYYLNHIQHIEPKVKIEGFLPVFELFALITNHYKTASNLDSTAISSRLQPYYHYGISTYLPLNFNIGRYFQHIRPELSYRYFNYHYLVNENLSKGIDMVGFRFFTYNLIKRSYCDIQPRMGQSLMISYLAPCHLKDRISNVTVASIVSYFPGLYIHHGLKINFGFEQYKRGKARLINNQILLPRGYDNLEYDQELKATLEYVFPFLYPDWSIGPVAYFKRFYATVFIDAAQIYLTDEMGESFQKSIVSAGIIISSEMHLLRFFMPFTPNLRISYLPQEKRLNAGISFSIDTGSY